MLLAAEESRRIKIFLEIVQYSSVIANNTKISMLKDAMTFRLYTKFFNLYVHVALRNASGVLYFFQKLNEQD